MNIRDILAVNSTAAQSLCDSKKSALELLSQLATINISTLDTHKVFDSIIERERLGSTALGHGVAIPHARIGGISQPIAALVQLKNPIPFDAPDEEFVDILFGLLLPIDHDDENLELLSKLAELLRREPFREALRETRNGQALYEEAIKVIL